MRPRVLVLTALLALGFPANSTASDTESLGLTASPTPLVSVQLERDSTLTVARLEPSSLGIVRVIHADGFEEFVANHRIRWIRDAEGRDRTSYVLDRGKSLGVAPVSIRFAMRGRSRSLRGRPLPVKGAFPVIQVGVLARLDPDRRHSDEHPATLAIDFGAIKNVSKRWGAGASLFYAGDGSYSRYGAKVRFRRWLGPLVAIDAAPGILFAEEAGRSSAPTHPGFVGELGLSLGDWISVTGQMEVVGFEERYYAFAPLPYNEAWPSSRRGSEVSWYLGTKLGGEAALGTFIAAFLLGAILVHGGSTLY